MRFHSIAAAYFSVAGISGMPGRGRGSRRFGLRLPGLPCSAFSFDGLRLLPPDPLPPIFQKFFCCGVTRVAGHRSLARSPGENRTPYPPTEVLAV